MQKPIQQTTQITAIPIEAYELSILGAPAGWAIKSNSSWKVYNTELKHMLTTQEFDLVGMIKSLVL